MNITYHKNKQSCHQTRLSHIPKLPNDCFLGNKHCDIINVIFSHLQNQKNWQRNTKFTSISARLANELLGLEFDPNHYISFWRVYDTRHSSSSRFSEKQLFSFPRQVVGELQLNLDLKTTCDVTTLIDQDRSKLVIFLPKDHIWTQLTCDMMCQ